MSLVAEHPHNRYGSAILIRNDLKIDNVYERVQGTVELIMSVMSGVVVHYVYKPIKDQFALPALGHRDLPHIVIGDFNSHSTSWGYDTTDNNGEAVEQLAYSCDLTLIHDAKLSKSFNSARWRFQQLPPARGGTTQRNIFPLANWSKLIHPGPSSSRSRVFMESSQLYAATPTHYSTEPLTTGPVIDPLLLL